MIHIINVHNYIQAGLRILHIDQTNYDLNEVAYFDVNAQERADLGGSFSNYPYFPCGVFVNKYNLKYKSVELEAEIFISHLKM